MIPLVKVAMPPKDALIPVLEEVLYSGMIAEGEWVYRFEAAFGETFGLPLVLGMSSGTAALHASLVLSGVGAGDEVISTPMTAEPTNLAILHAGATLVWGDVDSGDGTLDPESIRKSLTPRTKAILVVHYAGYPARMAEIMAIAKEAGIPVIEDCAHALGARHSGAPIGTLGDFAIFSFQAIKHLTTVDGGALVIKDPSCLDQAKRFRWFGMLKGVPRTEVDIQAVGYKYNMNNVTAAIGMVQLEGIGGLIARHIENGRAFDVGIKGIPGLEPAAFDPAGEPSYWLYTLLCEDHRDVERRLADIGVVASKLHKPNNEHSIFRPMAKPLPGLEAFYRRMIHLPCGWWVEQETRGRILHALSRG